MRRTALTGAAADIIAAEARLCEALGRLKFSAPITHVYNPLLYAAAPHQDYIRKYAHPGCSALMLGMNPGPWGMAQTGVPFGEVELVRDWLEVRGPVEKPHPEHPRRPILGFQCARSEVSGARLWGWAKDRFQTPSAFFQRFFVYNYCPLSFMDEGGRNLTPDKLPAEEARPLIAACDANLRAIVAALQPQHLIGIGGFAARRLRSAIPQHPGLTAEILHPSPASPAANRGWAQAIENQLTDFGLNNW